MVHGPGSGTAATRRRLMRSARYATTIWTFDASLMLSIAIVRGWGIQRLGALGGFVNIPLDIECAEPLMCSRNNCARSEYMGGCYNDWSLGLCAAEVPSSACPHSGVRPRANMLA